MKRGDKLDRWLDRITDQVFRKCDRVDCPREWTRLVEGHPYGLCDEHAAEFVAQQEGK